MILSSRCSLVVVLLSSITQADLPGALAVSFVQESDLQSALGTDAVWQAAGRSGVSGDPADDINELGLTDLGTAPFVYSVNFHDWDIVIDDIADLTTPQVTTTPVSVTYDSAGNLTFVVGPTGGFSTGVPILDQVTAPFGAIWIGVWSDHVQLSTHIRMDDLVLEGQALGGLDAWGEEVKPGSQPFNGMKITGLADPEDWILTGEFVIDYGGEPLGPGRDDARFVIFGTSIPEPSILVLGAIWIVAGIFRRRRKRFSQRC